MGAMNKRFHKPVPVASLDTSDPRSDPSTQAELAHGTAALLIRRVGDDPEVRDEAAVRRFVGLADELGIEVIAQMWSTAPAVSLPGSLWRLYALREWIRRQPAAASRWYAAGMHGQSVAEVVAGVETPPGPEEVARAADEILAGAFTGDYGVALLRAAAFVTVTARGRAVDEHEESVDLANFGALADDLVAAGRAWRAGHLD